ncbi:MAG: AEC family transporter [Thermotogaceae bacterium]|nr:AEC family transporter [Thermotogaceae bacterium]
MSSAIMNQIAVLFILIALGFLLRKRNLISNEFTKSASDLVIYVTLPSMIVASMDRDFSAALIKTGFSIFLCGSLMYVLLIVSAFTFSRLRKIEDGDRQVYEFMMIFGNVAYLGYPVLKIMFGEMGVFYGSFLNIWFNILVWTLGIKLMHKDQRKIDFFRAFLNPGLIAIGLGMIIFVFPVDIPQALKTTLNILGEMTVPLCMLLIGAFMTEARFKDFLANKNLYLFSLTKLVVMPLVMMLIMMPFKITSTVKVIPVVMSGMPAGVNTAIFARKFGRNYHLASQGVVLSTAISLLTIPILLLVVM